jgi:hypothetical protein
MPVECKYRPNRSEVRPFAERDAARIICRVVRAGGSKARIDRLYHEICTDPRGRPQKSAAQAALEHAIANIEANNAELEEAYRMFQIVNLIAQLALQLIPYTRLAQFISRFVAVANRLPSNIVAAKLDTITAQRAANDAALRILRQAAANESRFQRVAND